MTENTKSRERAEIAFSKVQSDFLSRSRKATEIDDEAAERRAKTERLRRLRLEKEAIAVQELATPKKAAKR